MFRRVSVWLPVVVCFGGVGAGRLHATTAADLCGAAADPCVVASDVAVSSGSDIDVGGRALVIRRGRTLDVGAGTMTVRAGRLTVEPGAVLGARSVPGGLGGTLVITIAGDADVQVEGTTKGRIDVSGDLVGGSMLLSCGGNLTVGGALLAQAGSSEGDGGTLDALVTGNILVSGSAAAGSGSQGGGGDVSLTAQGSITITGTIDASGGDLGGGSIDLDAGTTMSVGFLDAHGGGSSGDGGFMTITADGNITFNGQIDGTAAGTTGAGGGSGADIQILSLGSVRLNQQVIAPGGTPDGDGGSLDIQASEDVIVAAPLRMQGIGTDSCGGEVDIVANGNLSVAIMDVSGGSCGVGSVGLLAGGTMTLTGEVDGDAGNLGTGASITLAASVVQIGADVHANAGVAGNVHISACTIGIPAGAAVESLGTGGQNLIEASGQLTIAGALRAGAVNRLVYRSPSQPPLLTGSVVPVPTLVVDPTLPACRSTGLCGNGQLENPEACDDGNTAACDGCSGTCRIERCGNGVVECAELCDLGPSNGTPGATCDVQCRPVQTGDLLLLPGRPTKAGCFFEWGLRNPDGAIHGGFPSTTQSCVDGDPRCDGDGANDGVCSFQVSACVHIADPRLPDCRVLAISSVDLRRPSHAAPTDATDAANAASMLQTLETFGTSILAEGVPVRPGGFEPRAGLCTAPVSFIVPHAPGSLGRRRLYARTLDLSLKRNNNQLRMVCEPNFAICGNGGAPEIGEQCDDGNRASCDGCSAGCRLEACGNGVVECAEECDDGAQNGVPGNTCRADCSLQPPLLRVPGGGRAPSECSFEWALALGQPALDRKGLPDFRQECRDNDPTCDFDPTVGVCRFHVWACVAGEDSRLACPAAPVETATLLKPSERQPGPLRDALLTGLGTLPLPAGPGEVCSRRMDVAIPVSRRRVSFKTMAVSGGLVDKDGLRLRCNP